MPPSPPVLVLSSKSFLGESTATKSLAHSVVLAASVLSCHLLSSRKPVHAGTADSVKVALGVGAQAASPGRPSELGDAHDHVTQLVLQQVGIKLVVDDGHLLSRTACRNNMGD